MTRPLRCARSSARDILFPGGSQASRAAAVVSPKERKVFSLPYGAAREPRSGGRDLQGLLPFLTFSGITRPHGNDGGNMRTPGGLAVCAEVDRRLYSTGALNSRSTPDLILGCGDLPAYYLDYLVSKF